MYDDLEDVIRWYDSKTESIVDKYGGFGRVHFHTGYVPPGLRFEHSLSGLRHQLHRSQEEMLRLGAGVWGIERVLRGAKVLDIGAGLGGGSLFWAQEFGAQVVALTPVPRHVEFISIGVREAHASEQVDAVLGRAEELAHLGAFDVAVSIGASTYFDRRQWFRELAKVLPRGGHVCVEDTFLGGDPNVAAPFNQYWVASIGTVAEYHDAAASAGFQCTREIDVSDAAADFYRLSMAYAACELEDADETRRAHLQRSIPFQRWFSDMNRSRAFRDLLVHYVKL